MRCHKDYPNFYEELDRHRAMRPWLLERQAKREARKAERASKQAAPAPKKPNYGLTPFEELALSMEDVPGIQTDEMIKARESAKAKIAAYEQEKAA